MEDSNNTAANQLINETKIVSAFIISLFASLIIFAVTFRIGFKLFDALKWYAHWPAFNLMLLGNQNNAFQQYTSHMEEAGHLAHFYGILGTSATLSIIVFIFTMKGIMSSAAMKDRHLRGGRLLKDDEALAEGSAAGVRETKKEKKSLLVHPAIKIARKRLSKHILVYGASGAGKTVFLLFILKQLWDICKDPNVPVDRKPRMIIYDVKGDFTQLVPSFLKPLLIAPWDRRGVSWHVAADFRNKPEAQQLAAMIIEESKDPMWSNGARIILTAIFTSLINTKPERWTFQDVADLINSDDETLQSLVNEYAPEGARIVADMESKTTMGMMITLASFCGAIFDLAIAYREPKGFSIRKFIQAESVKNRVAIIQGALKYDQLAGATSRSIINRAVDEICDSSLPDGRPQEVYFILDEVPQMGKVERIHDLASKGRSKGGRLILGLQDFDQLREIYGDKKVNALVGLCSTHWIGRMAPGATSDTISTIVGVKEVEKTNVSASTSGPGVNHTVSSQRETRTILLGSEISALPDLDDGVMAYLYAAGMNDKKGNQLILNLKWPFTKTKTYREPVILADWVKPKTAADTGTTALPSAAPTTITQEAIEEIKQEEGTFTPQQAIQAVEQPQEPEKAKDNPEAIDTEKGISEAAEATVAATAGDIMGDMLDMIGHGAEAAVSVDADIPADVPTSPQTTNTKKRRKKKQIEIEAE